MANGKPFNPDKFTCASWHYSLGTKLRVYHGSSYVDVVVTDRGPNKRFKNREIDLSAASFSHLHRLKDGLIPVRIIKK